MKNTGSLANKDIEYIRNKLMLQNLSGAAVRFYNRGGLLNLSLIYCCGSHLRFSVKTE